MYFARESEKSASIHLILISAYKYQNFKYAESIISWNKKTGKRATVTNEVQTGI
jgi:hypothetical protein